MGFMGSIITLLSGIFTGGGVSGVSIVPETFYFLNRFKIIDNFENMAEKIPNTIFQGATRLAKQSDVLICLPRILHKKNITNYKLSGKIFQIYEFVTFFLIHYYLYMK